jgi:hypothetical protein
MHNGNRPVDETLPPYDRQMLELAVLPITRLLRLLGHDPITPDDAEAELHGDPSERRSSRFYGITLEQLMAAGLLKEGDTVTSTNGAWPGSGTVLSGGKIQVGTEVFGSPSLAAMSVKEGLSANGWSFWAVDEPGGRVPLATLRSRFLAARQESTSE